MPAPDPARRSQESWRAILDAARASFAEKGFSGANVSEIVARAATTKPMIYYHFGSKEGLRDACDEFAMAQLAALRAQGLGGSSLVGAILPESMRLQVYLVRSMMDGSATAAAMFARSVEAGEEWLATTPIKSNDPTAYAAVLMAMKMGMFLMRDQLTLALGEDVRTRAGHARVLRAAVEIFRQPLLSPELADRAYEALDPEE